MKRIAFLFIIVILSLAFLSSCGKSESAINVVEFLELGEKYLLEMEYEQAVVQFLKVIEIEPMNPRGYTGAAAAYVGLGQLDNAISVLSDGAVVLPDDLEISTMIEEVQIKIEQIKLAEEQTKSDTKELNNMSTIELLDSGEKYLSEMDYEQAVICFLKVLEIEPKNVKAYAGLAETYIKLENIDEAIEVLRQGLEQLPYNPELLKMLHELLPETTEPTLSHEEVNYELLYAEYMDSSQWQSDYVPLDEYELDISDFTITDFKIFDLDGNGILELLIHAEISDDIGPNGPERRDFFCTIKDNQVIQLLSTYSSSGTIGGDEISFCYDTETQIHIVCKKGHAGGFGGIASWHNVYALSDGILTEILSYSMITQVESNYIDGELDNPSLYYLSDSILMGESTFTVYEVNDEQVPVEIYEKFYNRFTLPISDEFRFE